MNDWSREETKLLKKAAASKYPSSLGLDKQERWKKISSFVGTRSKQECYQKYKELKQLKAQQKISSVEQEEDRKYANQTNRNGNAKEEQKWAQGEGKVSWNEEPLQLREDAKGQEGDDDEDFGLGFGGNTQQAFSRSSVKESKSYASSKQASVKEVNQPSYSERLPRNDFGRQKNSNHVENSTAPSKQSQGEALEMEEIDDFDAADFEAAIRGGGLRSAAGGRTGTSTGMDHGEGGGGGPVADWPMDAATAGALRRLAFGDERQAFNAAWQRQGFAFASPLRDLGYGIIQHEGGPCGVVAAVQAQVLKELLFGDAAGDDEFPQPGQRALDTALAAALASILWRAGGGRRAVVCLARARPYLGREGGYKPDGLTERCHCYEFASRGALGAFLRAHLAEFASPRGPGAVCLVYGACLSRGLAAAAGDMDGGPLGEPPLLMSRHGYASQEMVNLLLIGNAYSNVFDGEQTMEGEGSDVIRLRGNPGKSEIGFLTLFEAYDYVLVGQNYKTPEHPIWVICSESHYSTIFSTDPDFFSKESSQESFDLHYFDGLANQDEVIRLTVDMGNPYTGDDRDDKDLTPPIDKVIRTRWKKATIDWNGAEPIL